MSTIGPTDNTMTYKSDRIRDGTAIPMWCIHYAMLGYCAVIETLFDSFQKGGVLKCSCDSFLVVELLIH